MSLSSTLQNLNGAVGPLLAPAGGDAEGLLAAIERALGQPCVRIDTHRGQLERVSPDWPPLDFFRWVPVCEQVARHSRAEVIEDHSPLMLIAVPMESTESSPSRVAIVVLVTERVDSHADIESVARLWGADPDRLFGWARKQVVWSPNGAQRLVEAVCENHTLRLERSENQTRLARVSQQLNHTIDELDLLHRLTERLSLDHGARDLCGEVMDWLAEVLPSSCLVARWFPQEGDAAAEEISCDLRDVVAKGTLPLEGDQIDPFFEHLGPQASERTLTLDHAATSSPTWPYPGVREVISTPIRSHDRLVGWIAVMNPSRKQHSNDSMASLIASVATILGVHAGNRVLFHQLGQSINSSVRGISRALDAKDSYTHGHSERVAQIAVVIARRLGFSEDDLESLHLGGLVHDVGKIGIEDQVLRKPGKLTPEEYDHIKEHPRLGAKILEGIPELTHTLPIVLHHHEAWDGSGYPDGLVGEATPLAARVMAVADAFDAMGSDRSYRRGMPREQIEGILRKGAGTQWDPTVVDAYFKVRDAVQQIEDYGMAVTGSADAMSAGAIATCSA